METLKHNTPYPASRLQEVRRGQRLSVVTGPDIRCGHFDRIDGEHMQMTNGYARVRVALAEIRSFCLIWEDEKK